MFIKYDIMNSIFNKHDNMQKFAILFTNSHGRTEHPRSATIDQYEEKIANDKC